jgi:cation:H+ antiporter
MAARWHDDSRQRPGGIEMSVLLAIGMFITGLALVIYFAEKLVAGVVGTAAAFGSSAFWISVVFIGFDPENLAVGVTGSYERASGIALGSVVGSAMVSIALALGVTALIVPLTFARAPRRILVVPVLAASLAWGLMIDGELSRVDGVILLLGYLAAIGYLLHLNRGGVDIKARGEVAEALEKVGERNRWKALGLMALSLAAIVAGSEILVDASVRLVARFGWSDTFFGMTVLAFLVSVEELARELPAAIKRRPDITYGNVLGSVLAFFLFNAGVIALVRPVQMDLETRSCYVPVCTATILMTSIVMATRKVPRWFGGVLVATYIIFVGYGYTRLSHAF